MKYVISIIACVFILFEDRWKVDNRAWNPPEHCARFVTSNETLICTCHELDFHGIPSISDGRCNELILSYCYIYFISENTFANFPHLEKLQFSSVEIDKITSNQILQSLSNTLQSLTIVNTSLPIQESDFTWPKQITSLNLSKMNLTKFEIPQVLRNLEVLVLDVNDLQSLPNLKAFTKIHTLSFNDNPNLNVTYEDVVNICNLKELRADTLPGSNNQTRSLKVYCNCVRLKYWLDKNEIVNNIPQCEFKTPESNHIETECNFSYELRYSEGSDPCGREIISYDGPIVKKIPLRFRRFVISFFFAIFVIALFTSFLVYFLRAYIKKRAERASSQSSASSPQTERPKELDDASSE